MGYCCSILYLLLIFTFIQIQFRWKQDKMISHTPWMVVWKGETTNIEYQTGADIPFDRTSIKYGTPLVVYSEGKFVLSERTEIEVHIVAKVEAPALSFHRISLLVNDVELRTLDMFVPKSGVANNDMIARFILSPTTNLRIHHYYDSVWSDMNVSSCKIKVGFRSGMPNIYDVPFQ